MKGEYLDIQKDHPEKKSVYYEEFENPKLKGMYDQVWKLFNQLLERDKLLERNKKKLNSQ